MRYLRYLIPLLASLALMAIGSKSEHPEQLGLPASTKTLLEEIGKTGVFALALLIGSAAIKEVIEAALKESGKDLKETISSTFGDTGTKVEQGFNGLTTVVQAALLQMKGSLERAWSPEEVDRTLRKKAHSQAAASADTATVSVEKEITDALLSGEISRLEKATELLRQVQNPEYHLLLAYKFWAANRLDEAIKLAEEGLEIAQKGSDSTVSADLKNNLAYFYAEGNRVDKKDQAFAYTREARAAWPLNAEFLETEGCVKIAFGTMAEAIEGIQECTEAAEAKGDDTTLRRWLKRYDQRTF